ncbi:hypothetical protein A3A76_03580 [Candidatus Woesebacteria bacterium RIFCSPLOWO2_01_FULL_39_23]|uniref:Glycosyltransferase RgtA/B/C/D-like domain-containing protein n=1 Tax=Candidatus Woesebacteria bacterium RIFCSPHIGHO2_01_FULL_40_22 TaxID=1802499 RepID=A0A1F7YJL6_9BACT|nr:MAG: hypothetical protein A2141_00445 [Candidatus Woesebacteria bacterium RBG_16_40_11]OGM27536.1 MAG: hypothetical protein A2628_01980 [Candidatus Woesebacteria bacterium RIFCSPHIGHO2_01_FULL_40_22]OGM36128.1 MAG: hypothetical protein A3E41_02220 [Candidatus Woesebacteria bacterium RIFCSPHIGHO2_12_FULL_38_9]OGM62710.1 MAG: hypothetical protein A3A76_03580 [Candidatus Woesebacteria bacterium RIFCSPLOWO2_01_FULL_39_23]
MKNRITHILKTKYIEYIILSILILIGFAARLYKITNPIADWHSFRQADTASVSRIYIVDGINLFIPKYHDISRVQSGLFNPHGYRFVEFPIYNALHAFVAKNFTFLSFEVWGRLTSVFYTLTTSFVIFLIGRKLYGKWLGVISSACYLLLPYNIYFTRVILPEPLAILFAVTALWFFLLYQDDQKYKYLLLSSILLSLGILVKPYVVFFGLPLAYYFFNKYGLKRSLINKHVLISIIIVVLPFMLWRVWEQKFPEGIPFWTWTFNGDGIRFKPAFWKWIFGDRLGFLILGVWGVIPFTFGILSLRKKDNFLISLLLGMFLYVSIIATANVRHDYYQTLLIPVVSLVLAKGLLEMWKLDYGNNIVRKLSILFFVFLSMITSAFQIREFYKINHPEIIEAGNAVDRLTPKDAIVIANYNGDTAFLYQTKRRGWPVVELPINELIDEGAQYYVSVNYDEQTKKFMEQFQIVVKTDKYVILKLI